MRRTFGLIVLVAALANAQACLAQQDTQPSQEQQDWQQQKLEQQQRRTSRLGDEYRTMAREARRHAEDAKAPDAKSKWLRSAQNWDQLALQADRRP